MGLTSRMSNKVLLKLASLLAFVGAIYSMILGNFLLSILSLIISGICYFGSTKYWFIIRVLRKHIRFLREYNLPFQSGNYQIPFQQFGIMMALSIMFSFLTSVFVLPSMLVIWESATNELRAMNRTSQTDLKEKEGRIANLVTINFQNPCYQLRKLRK